MYFMRHANVPNLNPLNPPLVLSREQVAAGVFLET